MKNTILWTITMICLMSFFLVPLFCYFAGVHPATCLILLLVPDLWLMLFTKANGVDKIDGILR